MQEPQNQDAITSRLIAVTLDERSIARGNPNVDHEREVAILDLLEANSFALIAEDRLVVSVGKEKVNPLVTHVLSLSPFRRLIKDYFTVCDSYYAAIRSAPPSRIQSIDMGRRALHDEGSRLLAERLQGKISVDHDTARRLFTLICALHWRV